jgi:choline dehydrogenase-like flavoprotein
MSNELPAHADVLIVGAGSAGARLADLISVAPGTQVLVIEAGPDLRTAQTPRSVTGPNFTMAVGTGRFHWVELMARLTEDQQPSLYLQGRGLGGSSTINGQGAHRALPGDFDSWPSDGWPHWQWSDVLPAFMAIEDDAEFGAAPYHGTGGPIPVTRVASDRWGAVSLALSQSAMDLGHPYHADINAPDSTGLSPAAWTRRGERRVSANDAFLEPARHRPNLRVVCDAFVERLTLTGHTVTGARIRTPDGEFAIGASEVVLCAGAIQTPALLLRSGIGPAADLRALGIEVCLDLPGVGANLHDHPTALVTFPLAQSARAASAVVLVGHCTLRLSSGRTGCMADDLEIYPLDRGPLDRGVGGFMVSVMQPRSRGTVRLADREPMRASPVAKFRALSDPVDLSRLAGAVRYVSELVLRPVFGGVADGEPRAGEAYVSDLDDRQLRAWLLSSAVSHFHPVGSCKMGPPADPGSVVDTAGRVHGVAGLRIADASVIPEIPRSGTHLATLMLAERIGRHIELSL